MKSSSRLASTRRFVKSLKLGIAGAKPAHTQFRKGRSGNPKGRGKGAKSFASAFLAAMAKPVTIMENGKRRRVTKLDAAVTQLANDAARGDKKAIQLACALDAGPRAE